MNNLDLDEQVFVRSIATRASTGSLPLAALRAVDILDATGFGTIIIETVGTGQNQVDIMQAAHTIIAVSAPGLGDDIQAMKSGLLEVADIHVVSKSDLGGAAKTLSDIKNAVHMRLGAPSGRNGASGWEPVILPVSSPAGEGLSELKQAIHAHHHFLLNGDEMQQRCHHMMRQRIYSEAKEIFEQSFETAAGKPLSRRIEQVLQREITPTMAAQEMLKDHL
jgi:LAO/AO transport system kinase